MAALRIDTEIAGKGMPVSGERGCLQCGRCCEKWGWDQSGVSEDLVPWIKGNRQDILRHVSITFADGKRCDGRALSLSDLPRIARIYYWIGTGGRKMRSCPFFHRAGDGKAYCRIHGFKPGVCTSFTPWDEGIRDYALNCPACRDTAP